MTMRSPPDAETILRSLETRLRQFREAQATGDTLMVKGAAWRILFGALALINDNLGVLWIQDEARRNLAEVDLAIMRGQVVAPCPRCAGPAVQINQPRYGDQLHCLSCLANTPLTARP